MPRRALPLQNCAGAREPFATAGCLKTDTPKAGGQPARRIVAALAAGESVVFPDDASAEAGAVYLSDPIRLERMLAGG